LYWFYRMNTLAGRVGPSAPTMALVGAMVVAAMFPRRAMAAPTTVGGLGGLAATLAGVTPAGSNSVFPSTSCIVTCNPFRRDNYLFLAWSISMSRVACGAFPCMCLKYRKSSPRCAIDLSSGI